MSPRSKPLARIDGSGGSCRRERLDFGRARRRREPRSGGGLAEDVYRRRQFGLRAGHRACRGGRPSRCSHDHNAWLRSCWDGRCTGRRGLSPRDRSAAARRRRSLCRSVRGTGAAFGDARHALGTTTATAPASPDHRLSVKSAHGLVPGRCYTVRADEEGSGRPGSACAAGATRQSRYPQAPRQGQPGR